MKKIIEKFDDHKFFKNWVDNINLAYKNTRYIVDDIYAAKDKLSPEMSQIYVSRFIDYYSELKYLYLLYIENVNFQSEQERVNNYKVIRFHVDNLLGKYYDFVRFFSSLEDFKPYQNIELPEDTFFFE